MTLFAAGSSESLSAPSAVAVLLVVEVDDGAEDALALAPTTLLELAPLLLLPLAELLELLEPTPATLLEVALRESVEVRTSFLCARAGLNLTMTAVMLSHPVPSPPVSGARQSSNN